MSKYEVKSVVCDYGVFEDNELKLICNSHANALKIKEILETDSDMSKPYIWQDQRIAELEEQLKNAIMPKFKPNDDLFVIVGYKDEPKSIEQYYIDEIVVRGNSKHIEYRDIEKETIIGENNFLFATKEEAQAKLEELKGE
ncbi:MAG: hypothetical protein IKI95_07400 [Clostridia bacterium]|nr:hypothetical protein [Clostridia bacterium]